MKLQNEDWAYLQKRIEEIADNNYGDLHIKIRNQTMIVKGGLTDVREIQSQMEPVDKCVKEYKTTIPGIHLTRIVGVL